ncbi:sulfite exporter TauE/SafE family protein [Rothia sp. LK2588]|uniref:sulfite exporter TauE/SafE family protein n=1 Tax=Rothia sp. LK2588 TaxID=3114369 RepID=UPI0034CD9A23
MRTLILIALAGAVAQLVDGSLGMGFGVTSTTFLLAFTSLTPAGASAVVHVAELGTTLASGLSHWKLQNVDWKVVFSLGAPGAIGAFLGATVLSHLSLAFAKPVTSGILATIGAFLVIRFARGRTTARVNRTPASRSVLAVLGLVGGFVDSAGGGGWGPVTSSTLMSIGRAEPRRIVGTVNTAEFLVTLAACAGFGLGLWHELIAHLGASLALLGGGVLFAPVAAWLTTKVNQQLLGGFIGTVLVLTNLAPLLDPLSLNAPTLALVFVAIGVLGVCLSLCGVRRARTTERPFTYSESITANTPEPVTTGAGLSHTVSPSTSRESFHHG